MQITTWAEFVTACGTAGEHQIMNDIDCNNEIPEGVASTITVGGNITVTIDGSYTETENGVTVTKNRVIRNLRTHISNPVPIFNINSGSASYSKIWKNIDFINLVLDSYFLQHDGGNRPIFDFRNCRFVGRRTKAFGNLNASTSSYTNTNMKFTSCFFNIPNVNAITDVYNYRLFDKGGANTVNRDSVFATTNYCWFRETYTSKQFSYPACQSYNSKMDGCYVDGEVGISTSTSSTGWTFTGTQVRLNNFLDYGNMQNVFDVKLRATTTEATTVSTIENIDIYAPKGLFKKDIVWENNSGSIVSDSVMTNQNSTYAIFATPAEMKDPATLYSKGFDIIVPNS